MKINKELKIGIFAVAMLLLLYWGINYLKGRDVLNLNNVYYASYDQVNGMQPSSAIVVKGFKVGSVTKISYDPSVSNRIVMQFTISSKYQIPNNSRARIFSDGLLGGKAVEIELGDSPQMLVDGDTLHSLMDKDFLEVAGSELEFFKQKANRLVEEVMTTLHNINILLEGNNENIAATTSNLAAISGTFRQIAHGQQDDIEAVITNLNLMSSTLRGSATKIDNITTNFNQLSDSLAHSNIPQLIRTLNATTTELNQVVGKINGNEGTLGRLINDPALYDSLTMATNNLSKLLVDVKANPKRYVSFSVFGKKSK